MKIPNSFSTIIFNKHRIRYEPGAFSESDFLPSTVDCIGDINRYLGSVNLCAIDINISDFGEGFNPSKLDYNNSEKENRRSVLNVLKKIVDLSSQNIRRNADGYIEILPHDNDSLL